MCQPSSIESALSSIRARLNRLQTVIVHGQESLRTMHEMSKLHRSRSDASVCTRWSGSSHLASVGTLSRTACPGTELHCKPTWSVDQLREMCQDTVPTSVIAPSSASVQEALKRMSLLRDNDFTAKAVRELSSFEASVPRLRISCTTTNDGRVQHSVQFESLIRCDNQLGDASAPRNLDTTITSSLPDSSLAPLCGILQEERMRVRRKMR